MLSNTHCQIAKNVKYKLTFKEINQFHSKGGCKIILNNLMNEIVFTQNYLQARGISP